MLKQGMKQSHVLSGLAGLFIGAFALFEAWNYPIGSVTRMGPGYFPIILSVLLMVLSLGVLFIEGRSVDGPDIERPSWRGLVWIVLAVMAFAASVETLGLAPAILAAVILSAQADDDLHLKETLILAASCTVICVVIFIYILGLPLEPIEF